MTIRQRVLDELRNSPKPLRSSQIAQRLDLNDNTIRVTVYRLGCDGLAVRVPPSRWAACPPPSPKAPALPPAVRGILETLRGGSSPMTLVSLSQTLGIGASTARAGLAQLGQLGLVWSRKPRRTSPREWWVTRKACEGLSLTIADRVYRELLAHGEWLTFADIAERAGLTDKQVKGAFARLEAAGRVEANNEQTDGRRHLWRAVEA